MPKLTGDYRDVWFRQAAEAKAVADETYAQDAATGIFCYLDARFDEWVCETKGGARLYGKSRRLAFADALDAYRVERKHAMTNPDDELPYSGETPLGDEDEFVSASAQDRDSAEGMGW